MIYNKKFCTYINYYIENPFKTIWKARKYFKFPKVTINFFFNLLYNCPYASYKNVGKIFDISCCDVSYKLKYDSIRYERPPYIWICFFRLFGFSINFNKYYYNEFNERMSLDTYYWEYILNFLRYKHLLCYSNAYTYSRIYFLNNFANTDECVRVNFKYNIPVVQYSLTNKGIERLKNELQKRNNIK